MMFAGACSEAPKDDRVVFRDNVHTTTPAQRDSAMVSEDRVVFAATGNEALLALVPGDVLVSDRARHAAPSNPMGFGRRVRSVTREGDRIVIMTDQAAITDIVDHGKLEIVANGADLRPIEEYEPDGPGGARPQAAYAASYGDTLPFPLPPSVIIEGQTGLIDLAFDGSPNTFTKALGFKIEVKGGNIDFTPRLALTWDVERVGDPSTLRMFDIALTGDLSARTELAATVSLESTVGLEPAIMKNLSARITQGLMRAGQQGKSGEVTLFEKALGFTTTATAPPVVVTFDFAVKARCELSVKGEISAQGTVGLDGHVGASAHWETSWTKASEFSMKPFVSPLNVTYGGAIELKCSVAPEIKALVYGVLGPSISVGPYAKIAGTYKETCDATDPRPKPEAELGYEVGVEASAAMSAQVPVIGADLAIGKLELGKIELAKDTWFKKELPRFLARGRCTDEVCPASVCTCEAGATVVKGEVYGAYPDLPNNAVYFGRGASGSGLPSVTKVDVSTGVETPLTTGPMGTSYVATGYLGGDVYGVIGNDVYYGAPETVAGKEGIFRVARAGGVPELLRELDLIKNDHVMARSWGISWHDSTTAGVWVMNLDGSGAHLAYGASQDEPWIASTMVGNGIATVTNTEGGLFFDHIALPGGAMSRVPAPLEGISMWASGAKRFWLGTELDDNGDLKTYRYSTPLGGGGTAKDAYTTPGDPGFPVFRQGASGPDGYYVAAVNGAGRRAIYFHPNDVNTGRWATTDTRHSIAGVTFAGGRLYWTEATVDAKGRSQVVALCAN